MNNVPLLPADPPGWKERDDEFRQAREDIQTAGQQWLAAGGRWEENMEPSHPLERAAIRAAEKRYKDLTEKVWADLVESTGDQLVTGAERNLSWLEADPFGYNTGYRKSIIMQEFCHTELSPSQQARLRDVLIRLVMRGKRQEFRDACRLARYVDIPEFHEQLHALTKRPELDIQTAATRMLKSCQTKGTRTHKKDEKAA